MNNIFKWCIIIIFFVLTTIQMMLAQTFDWVKQIGGKRFDEGIAAQSDQNGNVYAVGYFDGNTFNPINGYINTASYGDHQGFLVKYDSAGNIKRFISIGSAPTQDHINSFYIDHNGYLYIIGLFQGIVDFDPGPKTYHLQQQGPSDNYLLKLDTALNFVWVKQLQGTGNFNLQGLSIKVDDNGNIYFTGTFKGTVDLDPNPSFHYLTSNDYDVFFAKLDSLGNLIWANKFGGKYEDYGNAIDIDRDQNVYITGYFNDTLKISSISGNSSLLSNGKEDIFLLKLLKTGEIVWCKKMGGVERDVGNSVDVDFEGNIFVTGYFSEIADFNPTMGNAILLSGGKEDIFILKLDANGNFQWVKKIGGFESDRSNCINTDIFSNTYISGIFKGTVDFDPDSIAKEEISTAGYSGFVLKLDSNGKFNSVLKLGSSVSCVHIDSNANIVTTGYFIDSVDFDPGNSVFNLKSFGAFDIFVSKLNQCGGVRYDDHKVCDSLIWIDGNVYSTINTKGTYKIKNKDGCDSLIILNLIIENEPIVKQVLASCDSLIWNDLTLKQSGQYSYQTSNVKGCDSTVTLDLTIRKSSDTLIQTTACRKFGFNDKVYTEGGKYYIKLRNRQGCDSLIELDLNIITLDTNISKMGNTLIALDSLATYQWVDCDDQYALIAHATEKTYTPDKNGNYAVILNSPPCTDTSLCVSVIVSQSYNSNEQGFLVYPNPATNKLYFKLPDVISGEMLFSIRDIHGRELMNRFLVRLEEKTIELDVNDLIGGLYSLYIQSPFGVKYLPFLKL